MDFAKKLMAKYGWKEGDGLGKNQSGICKPLKANLKFDTSGLGVDKAADFNNHWWERVFNEAANNIDVVNTNENDVKLNVKDINSVEISTKEYSVEKFKKHKRNDAYNNFLKSSTLTNLGIEQVQDTIQMSDIENNKFKQLTDEELFAACGGRTAHKGARHGLKLCGKLTRIEQQEKELLKRMGKEVVEKTEQKDELNNVAAEEWTLVKKKNKKHKKNETLANDQPNDDINKILYNSDYCIKSKKKKKKQKSAEKELNSSINAISMTENFQEAELLLINEQSRSIKKNKSKKKKKKNNTEYEVKLYRDKVIQDETFSPDEVDISIDKNNSNDVNDTEKLVTKKTKKDKKKLEKLNKISKSKSKKLSKKLKKNLGSILNEFESSVNIKSV